MKDVVVSERCETELHAESGQVYRCQGPLRLSTRDRRDRLALPVLICGNPRCGTAKVRQKEVRP